jgi:thiol-disulfide isomerase/thioredoxin
MFRIEGMKVQRFLLALSLFFLSLQSACVTVTPVSTLEEAQVAGLRGDLLAVDLSLLPQLEIEGQKRPVLVEFMTDWCMVCKKIRPELAEIASEGKGRLLVAQINLTGREELREQLDLMGFPAFRLYYPGQARYASAEGASAVKPLARILRELPSQPPDFGFRQVPLGASIKAVLIAGSSTAANFGEELRYNWMWLQERGLKPEEIACFYAKPNLIHYFADQKQFDSLQEFLKICGPADRKSVVAAIRQALANKPSYFYLYASSHGNAAEHFTKTANCPSEPETVLHLDMKDKTSCPSETALTPSVLAGALQSAPETKKYVILQSCYSGGFIYDTRTDQPKRSPLADLPNLTMMTASSPYSASFGCDTSGSLTWYGHTYLKVMANQETPFPEFDWSARATDIASEVTQLERRLGIPKDMRSEPQFFQSESTQHRPHSQPGSH